MGTIVNPHILNATTRMDLEKEFLEMVSDAGYVSDMKIERIGKIPAEKEALFYDKMGNKIYSEHSDINFQVNCLEKRMTFISQALKP